MTGSAERFITGARGLRLAYDSRGPSKGAPVLLLHGGGQTRHAWGATASMLAERGYQVLSLDLRGHGESDWSADNDYGFDAFRDDVVAVMAQLDAPVILVGASLGGVASLLAAGGSASGDVRALILVDVTTKITGEGVDGIRAFMTAHPDGFGELSETADAVAAYLPHRPRPTDLSGLMKNLRPRGGRLYWHWDPNFIEAIERDRLSYGARLSEAALGVRAPTLLVRGEESEVVLPQDVEAFRALMPHAEVVGVPAARHMVAGDQNTVFAHAILEYLERTAASRS